VEAARLLTMRAARLKDAGERSDLEAGMAKLFASEAGRFCVEEAFRIHGGYGYSKEYEIERLYRDAPLLLIGEGTSEIQRMVIGRALTDQEQRDRKSTRLNSSHSQISYAVFCLKKKKKQKNKQTIVKVEQNQQTVITHKP